jgi:hypothetical protein
MMRIPQRRLKLGRQGEVMAVVPLKKTARNAGADCPQKANAVNLVRIAAAGTLLASGVLLVAGKRRAGLATAVTGAALAMLDQKEIVSRWWNALPGQLDEIQRVLGRTQAAVEDLSVQGEKLRRVLRR